VLAPAGCTPPARRGSGGDAVEVETSRAATSGPRSSPFEPPVENGRTFVTDSGPFMDTGCTFRSGGPLQFDIEITRSLGDLNADGTLANIDVMIANGQLSPTATLQMPVFDVDSDAIPTPDVQPEVDVVSFNGEQIGTLSGSNNIWKLNSFQIDIHKVKFAARAAIGSTPTAALNHVQIDIDTANVDEDWCTSVDWGSLKFAAGSPVILVHGNNSNGKFFERQGLVGELQNRGMLVDTSVKTDPDSIVNNGRSLAQKIPDIAKSFGADQIHIIAHSKGGLDTREFLAVHQPALDSKLHVLSFTTLSTPHNGSALADVTEQTKAAMRITSVIKFQNIPSLAANVAMLLPSDGGRTDLTTSATAAFNQRTAATGLGQVIFNTIGADADVNANGVIDRSPDEYKEMRDENIMLRLADLVGQSERVVNEMYSILLNTKDVTVDYQPRPRTLLGPFVEATVTANPSPQKLPNDLLVTIPSAFGIGSVDARASNVDPLVGSRGRNHSNVADGGVAAILAPWLLQVDQQRGGLQ
jgi:triacylglycerol esterase/lipase EstA (alpha/beta hydrolase family)